MIRHFFIHTNPEYINSPDIINWFDLIDKKNISLENAHKLPNRELLYVKSNPNLIFTDVISFPFFIVSTKVKNVIKLYEPTVLFKQLVLLDAENEQCSLYHLPILPQVECLSEKSILTLDRSKIIKAAIDHRLLPDTSIFKLAGVKDEYIVARLDIVESMLRRQVEGVGLTPIEII